MIIELSLNTKRNVAKGAAIFSILFFVVDLIYKDLNNISYINRQLCIVNKLLPKFGFLLFEYYVELSIMVFLGVFVAAVLENYFTRFKILFPNNLLSAFLYASLLPVCACSVIPLIKTLKGKLSFRNIIAFVVSAPLLSPYILIISLSVLGPQYTILRIAASFLLAASTGILMEVLSKRYPLAYGMVSDPLMTVPANCDKAPDCGVAIQSSPSNLPDCEGCSSAGGVGGCRGAAGDIYIRTYQIFKDILPYIMFAGTAGLLFEYISPNRFLLDYDIDNRLLSIVIVGLIGVPIYFCNGTEVLFLRPLMHTNNFAMGTALAFSLSPTAICVTSAVMLIKFLGKRLTIFLTVYIFIFSVAMGYFLNLIL